jgi:hypothetical protein
MSSPAHANDYAPPAVVALWQRRALLVAVPFSLAALAGWALAYLPPGNDQFFRSYLVGFTLVLGLALGSLGLLMVYHATGGNWGTVSRRILEAGSRTLWAVALAFLPILIGVHRLYPWAQAELVANDAHLQRVGPAYLNLRLFVVRAVIYFAVWLALAWWLNRQSARLDREPVALQQPLRSVSCPGLVAYGFTMTFAAIDWTMSLNPHWTSTIWGLLYIAGQGLIALALTAIVLARLAEHEPMKRLAGSDQFHDLGKMILAATMLWGWFTLSQWLIIWAGNLPEEISFYLARTSGGWRQFNFFLVIGQFLVPFFLLLSRGLKSTPRQLAALAVWIIFMRYWDLYWFVMPSFADYQGHFHYSWQDAVVPIALLSWWLYLFFGYLRRRPLVAVYDERVSLLLNQSHELEAERA